MERRIMDQKAIDQRIGDFWFTNGYGDRFPARNSHVMLAIEGGMITYSSNHHDGGKREHSSERLCIRLQQRDPNDNRHGYWLLFYEYGDGKYREIFQTTINARYFYFHWEYKDGRKMMKLFEGRTDIAFISFPENATIYEDDWRKCEKCGLEHRFWECDLDTFMRRGECAYRPKLPACSCCGHPSQYY